jgi:hypothetical protein
MAGAWPAVLGLSTLDSATGAQYAGADDMDSCTSLNTRQ